MKLYLIRHGETVDNIAGNLAGVTDSALTNYGVEQTKQLGKYFATTKVTFTHIYASPLNRAYKTAEAICIEQVAQGLLNPSAQPVPDIIKVEELIEQDFGSYEGKPFGSRQSPSRTGREVKKNAPDFVDVESKESMGKRADRFLEAYLLPIVDDPIEPIVAIVSHGMLLSTLWRRILRKIAQKSLSIAPEVTAARGAIILEHPGGWSNTGYLELLLTKITADTEPLATRDSMVGSNRGLVADNDLHGVPFPASLAKHRPGEAESATETRESNPQAAHPHTAATIVDHALLPKCRTDFSGFRACIVAIDSKAHLIGLKRQRGGIGRLAHDQNQSKLTSFFKRPRTG